MRMCTLVKNVVGEVDSNSRWMPVKLPYLEVSSVIWGLKALELHGVTTRKGWQIFARDLIASWQIQVGLLLSLRGGCAMVRLLTQITYLFGWILKERKYVSKNQSPFNLSSCG